MEQLTCSWPGATTQLYLDASLVALPSIVNSADSILITDENLLKQHSDLFKNRKKIILPTGEDAKSLEVLERSVADLIEMEAGRDCMLVGIGGGVVTDFTGFLAGIYKRGVRFGFVPTSLLAMVDAAVGGKNGLNAGSVKNMIGLIRQPDFLLYDYRLLQSLSEGEWINGFAEIIKHAAVLDQEMFEHLENTSPGDYRSDVGKLAALVKRNVLLKYQVVQEDEFESGNRKLLNFGHTFGHALERLFKLSHGHAVAIGMLWAAKLSVRETGFREMNRLKRLIAQYSLPVTLEKEVDLDRVLSLVANDKKRRGQGVDFVLLEQPGRGIIRKITLEELEGVILSCPSKFL